VVAGSLSFIDAVNIFLAPTQPSIRAHLLSFFGPSLYIGSTIPVVNPDYECKKHGLCAHTFFGSYRVNPDASSMEALTHAIETSPSSLRQLFTMFWDKQCLPIGKDWEQGFCNCLRTCKEILLLVSPEAVKRCLSPDNGPDNFLLELDLATELQAAGEVTVRPIFMVEKGYPGGHDAFLPPDPR
jgi:hypothetical protein